MKTHYLAVFLAGLSIPAFSGELDTRAVKPVVPVPSGFVREETIVRDTTVDYRLKAKGDIYITFNATHTGRLTYVRLVSGDFTVYEWNVLQDPSGKVLFTGEDGEHLDNKVRIDRQKWMKFFAERVALPAFEFMPERTGTRVEEGNGEWEFVGYTPEMDVLVRSAGSTIVRTLKKDEILFPVPMQGKFLLASKDGRICPLIQVDGKWVVPVGDLYPATVRISAK